MAKSSQELIQLIATMGISLTLMAAANLAKLRWDGLVQMGPPKLQTHVKRSAATVSTSVLWLVMTETL